MNTQLIICWFLLIDSWMWQMHAFINIWYVAKIALLYHDTDVNPSVIVILSCWLCWVQDSSIKVEPIDTQNWLQVGFSASVKHSENPLWNFNQIKICFKGLRMVEPTFWKKNTQKMQIKTNNLDGNVRQRWHGCHFLEKRGDRLWGAVIGWVGHIGFLGIAGMVRFKPYRWATPEASIYATGWTEDFQAPWWTSMFNAILDEL